MTNTAIKRYIRRSDAWQNAAVYARKIARYENGTTAWAIACNIKAIKCHAMFPYLRIAMIYSRVYDNIWQDSLIYAPDITKTNRYVHCHALASENVYGILVKLYKEVNA